MRRKNVEELASAFEASVVVAQLMQRDNRQMQGVGCQGVAGELRAKRRQGFDTGCTVARARQGDGTVVVHFRRQRTVGVVFDHLCESLGRLRELALAKPALCQPIDRFVGVRLALFATALEQLEGTVIRSRVEPGAGACTPRSRSQTTLREALEEIVQQPRDFGNVEGRAGE